MNETDLKNYSKDQLKRMKKKYEIKSNVLKGLIKVGLSAHAILPFIMSFLIVLYGEKLVYKPYVLEDKNKFSNGFNIDELGEREFIYSTPWIDGKRDEYLFRIKDNIDLSDAEEFSRLSLEELNSIFELERVRSISSEKEEKDFIYGEDMIIIQLGNDGILRTKMHKEKTMDLLIYIAISFIIGISLKKIEEIISHSAIRDNLNDKLSNLEVISEEEMRTIKSVLEKKTASSKEKCVKKTLKLKKI